MKSSIRARRHERGQITIFVVLALSTFLLAFVGVATDCANWWYQRQNVQSAADASCQATAVDLLLTAEGQPTGLANFIPTLNGTLDCSGSPSAAPCVIAKYNGYDPSIATNKVVMTFPSSIVGAPPAPTDVAIPYVQADVTTQVTSYFTSLVTGQRQVTVHAKAACGLVDTPGPVPIVVLHPTDSSTINMNGSKDAITIIGGPQQSIQVNSSSADAVTSGSLSVIDLSQGGPNYTGSNFGTWGGQSSAPGTVNLGSTGQWIYPHYPISDPYRTVAAPSQPPTGVATPAVPFMKNGCPDTSGCTEYTRGYYSGGIKVQNATAIFDPGVYYLGGQGLLLDSNSIVRISTAVGDGSGGVMFYFSDPAGTASVYISSNSGKPHGSETVCSGGVYTNCVVQYHTDGSSEHGVGSVALQCPGGAAPPSQVPSTLPGNVMLAPCTGTYSDPSNQNRGFLFFQDRSVGVDGSHGNNPPQWQGGGSTLAAGFMYFHNCRNGDTTGTGTCTSFGDVFSLGGVSGSTSYAVGSLITDRIASNGNPGLVMILNPNKQYDQLKIAFFQ